MHPKNVVQSFHASFLSLVAMLALSAPAIAQDVLTGDIRLACEAILCLSTGSTPSECSPSLDRYFSIDHDDFSDTIRDRINFLNLCPVANQTPQMTALVRAIAHGAGRCDAQSLNVTLRYQELNGGHSGSGRLLIRNRLPGYCAAYIGHEFTDFTDTLPRYVGVPDRGGMWVEAVNYDAALEAYNERIAEEDRRDDFRNF